MKKLYKALAVAAVVAVSLLSAQPAKALNVNLPDAITNMEDDDDKNKGNSSAEDMVNDLLRGLMKTTYQNYLEFVKEHNTQLSKSEVIKVMEKGNKLGYNDEEILSYINNISLK